jgi:hypothetical protein
VPALLSSLIDVPADVLSGVLAADGVPRPCLVEWLGRVPDPRSPLGRWHPLGYVLGLAVCAFTAAGHDSPVAIAEWAAGCSREILQTCRGGPPLLARFDSDRGRWLRGNSPQGHPDLAR